MSKAEKIEFLSNEGRDILQRLSYMIRYNNEIHIHNENVAEHSFYVAVYTLLICDFLGIESSEAVKFALIHDVSETITSDIPHNVKNELFAIGKICDEFERDFNKVNFGIKHHIEGNSLSEIVVALADMLSVRQYALKEVEYGNIGKFGPILQGSSERLAEAFHKLGRYIPGDKLNELEILIKGEN